MNSPVGRTPGSKKKPISQKAFGIVTVLAIIVAVALITMGRVSSSTATAYNPLQSTPPSSKPASTTTPSVTPSSSWAVLNTTKGSSNAPITIIEYSDFQCAHCQEFALTLEGQLDKTYVDTGKVLFIYKFMIGYGEESLRADEAAASAAEQGQFWPYYYQLMQLRASPSVDDLPLERLENLAQQLGLDMPAFKDSLESRKYEAKVRQDDADGRALGVTGTPTFFINGIKMAGATSIGDFQNIIDPMLEKLAK